MRKLLSIIIVNSVIKMQSYLKEHKMFGYFMHHLCLYGWEQVYIFFHEYIFMNPFDFELTSSGFTYYLHIKIKLLVFHE